MHRDTHTTDHADGSVGFPGLFAIVVSAMVGGGVFSLPQNMAVHAAAGGQLLAWAVTGVGMWCIVNTFRTLTEVKPQLKDGLYTYARQGFGRFVGFLVAYGYWLCNCFSIIAYGVLIMSTLDTFFPGTFSDGNNVASVVAASALLWTMTAIAMLGTRTGAVINIVGTVCKIVPVAVFIVALCLVFRPGVMLGDFWGQTADGRPLAFHAGDLFGQMRDSMLVTLWLFIGMEGAVVVSGSARSPKAVSRATVSGYVAVLALYLLVSLLPLGVYGQRRIAAMANPSMSVIMEQRFGLWGAVMVNVGVIVSVLFSWLVWMLMISQMPLFAARDGIWPRAFLATNRHGAPKAGILLTAATCQLLFILCHFVRGDAWNVMISITSVMSMPCYLLCCLYLWKVAAREPGAFTAHGRATRAVSRRRALATGVLGSLFSLFLVYAAGLRYLMVACVLFAIGLPIFAIARRQSAPDKPFLASFSMKERVLFAAIVLCGVCGLVYTVRGGLFAAM
ncbi:arginine:agmatine antiporter [Bifidobacterium italicum]|uniref:Arginine:agmatine antiporter n=1 Tax=Bifidobacterium italicum TaxID=1960968 RepID=A0A2A2EET5_9BIFI|nr:basic amino acid/polyamine antiporter [Bifidobacterium italicum]PAU67553.1 arginine:agmatine antiporter [Bifidobacterium italicum]